MISQYMSPPKCDTILFVGQINQELLEELEEENKALRSELRSSINNTQQLMSLENEVRRLRAESKKYQSEVWTLKDVGMKLKQVP